MTMKLLQTDRLTSSELMAVSAVEQYLRRALRGKNLAFALDSIFAGGIENANDTVFIDAQRDPHGRTRDEWLYMFEMSMGVLLAGRSVRERYPRVLEVFAAIKVQP